MRAQQIKVGDPYYFEELREGGPAIALSINRRQSQWGSYIEVDLEDSQGNRWCMTPGAIIPWAERLAELEYQANYQLELDRQAKKLTQLLKGEVQIKAREDELNTVTMSEPAVETIIKATQGKLPDSEGQVVFPPQVGRALRKALGFGHVPSWLHYDHHNGCSGVICMSEEQIEKLMQMFDKTPSSDCLAELLS